MLLPITETTNQKAQQISLLEKCLVLAVVVITASLSYSAVTDSIYLHLYYFPVVFTGFYLGRYRARLMAWLCIFSGWCLMLAGLESGTLADIPQKTYVGLMLWSAMLLLIAILVGKLSDAWRESLASLRHAHQKDVLTDGLTSIANRRAFEFELTRRLAQWQRDGTPLTLMMLDIDHFKKFNDRYGHPAGDAILKGVAQVLQTTVRKADLVARFGGEEFVILLPGIALSEAKDIADRIRSLIEMQRFAFSGLTLRVTTSLGFAQMSSEDDPESFTKRADAALYSAKEAGRNCVFFHNGKSCVREGAGEGGFENHPPAPVDTKELTQDFYLDETTGLPTRETYLGELRRRVAECHRYGSEIVLALVRIDQFNAVANSDPRIQKSLIATIGRLICSQLRETDLVARYGADSFAILMPSTTMQGASFPLSRIRSQAEAFADAQYPGLSYAVSIGTTEPGRGEPSTTVLQGAELALQSAIEAGGSCVMIHDCGYCHTPSNLVAAGT